MRSWFSGCSPHLPLHHTLSQRKLKAPLWLLFFWRVSKTPLPGSSPFFGVIVSYKLIFLTEYLASMACHTPILGPVIPRWSLPPQTKSKGTNWLDCVDSSPGARVFPNFIIIQPNKFSHFGRVTPFPTTFYPSFPAEWAALPVAATPQGRFGTRRRAALGLVASRGSSLDSRRRNLVLHGAFQKIQAYNPMEHNPKGWTLTNSPKALPTLPTLPTRGSLRHSSKLKRGRSSNPCPFNLEHQALDGGGL